MLLCTVINDQPHFNFSDERNPESVAESMAPLRSVVFIIYLHSPGPLTELPKLMQIRYLPSNQHTLTVHLCFSWKYTDRTGSIFMHSPTIHAIMHRSVTVPLHLAYQYTDLILCIQVPSTWVLVEWGKRANTAA